MPRRCFITITSAIFLLIPLMLNAQDTIHLRNGDKLEGKVVTIEPDRVVISQGENKPTRVFLKSEIKVIVFADGSVETFDDYYQSDKKRELSTSISLKKPGNAALWSFFGGLILPAQGLGQFYNGQLGKGFLFFSTGAAGYLVMYSGLNKNIKEDTQLGATIYLVSWIVSTIDAYSSAKSINERLLSIQPILSADGYKLCATIRIP